MKLKSVVIAVFATLAMLGCWKKSNDEEQHPSLVAESQTKSVDSNAAVSRTQIGVDSIRDNRKTFFRIPEDVDKDLFVVAFYNEVEDCPEAIIYNDAKKKSASKITYFDDGTTFQHKLVPESDGSFREIYDEFPEDKPHYIINPSQVKFVHSNGSIGATFRVLASN
ncbi:hypothetical protein [Dyadobacter sp. LHD-138]|uniref:hypothetical protein n=1 Tax=Dyadobacter sp. LHD-138 TaxID=3071413 RepID=UPI0027E1DAAC|nr:hypothetical protein [Dyadobacter sp. LHD-138]MDQ6482410.1 hypothetical protein [Dyadobacter sp. LHD-138]